MKKMVMMFLVLCLAAFLAQGAGAATYYVNAMEGKDKNSGTSPSSPWQSLDKINNSSFLPGDKILFKRNQSWGGRLIIRDSGAKRLPIILGSYGRGNKPVINGDGSYAIMLDGVGFITIINLEIINEYGKGLRILNGSVNGSIIINSCDIHNNLTDGITVKDRGNLIIKNNHIYANGYNGVCVYFSDDPETWSAIKGHNVKIINNEIHNNSKNGVYLAGHNARISQNTMYANGSNRDNYHHNMYLIGDNSIVESNVFRDAYYNSGFRYEGSNMIFRYNFLKANLKHNLSFWNDFPEVMSNNKVYYNIFAVKKFSEPSYYVSTAIFVGKAEGAGIFDGIEIYNNSIFADDDRACGFWLEGCDNIDLKNNMVKIGDAYLIHMDNPGINIESDYNIFNSSHNYPFYNGNDFLDFFDWQSPGNDFHSQFIDPKWVNPQPAADVDFALEPDSPAMGAGFSLSLTRDYLGNQVPPIPDIGALQFY